MPVAVTDVENRSAKRSRAAAEAAPNLVGLMLMMVLRRCSGSRRGLDEIEDSDSSERAVPPFESECAK